MNITRLPTPAPPAVPRAQEPYDRHRAAHTPLVIDNGSTAFRWGFASSPAPQSGPNVIAKYKERKTNKPLLLFGEGVDLDSGAKAQARNPWEGDVLLNFDALENALDYAFVNLGIDTPSVDHPVLMTERLASPLHSRSLTSELMFELYSVPSLAYCVDGVMSFYQNNKPAPQDSFSSDGLVISFNTASTSVIPVLNGKGIMSHAKRIPWGCSQASDYLLKLIKLQEEGFDDDVGFEEAIKKLENDLKKARKKEAEGDDNMEEPSFPLVDVPDADLDEEGLKEKRKQRLMKAGFEARVRAKREKEREKAEKEKEERKEEEERDMDLEGWSKKMRQEQEVELNASLTQNFKNLINKIKDRARRKAALGDRKSAAAQARMKSIANLANDDRLPKKKRKGGAAAPSSDEEEDLNQLSIVESKLLAYDPTFTHKETHASITSQRSALISAFRPIYEEGDIEGGQSLSSHFQLLINVA
ncbi:hypothetical protein C0993_007372 [Termitomyces sp. T159_Od127]|nr:hypothetical protein C0993_007372 [Termitomyces sp. T159_Od127]